MNDFVPEHSSNEGNEIISRAQGCLLGQLAGDALGSLVEFESPEQIKRQYPNGVLELADGGTWGTIAGQPTDDSEMALALARVLVEKKTYDSEAVRQTYVDWLDSGPFDCGRTVAVGLSGLPNPSSQANGALMRISPLGIFGVNTDEGQLARWASEDASLTHPNQICQETNVLFTLAIARAIRTGSSPRDLYEQIIAWSEQYRVDESIKNIIADAAEAPPGDYGHQQGWVIIAFQNALWQLLHAASLEEGVVDTVMQGGDTDTNAAICGALLGAVYGREAVPEQWVGCLLNCRPEVGKSNVRHPRPECYWPVDVLTLAEQLVNRN